jgi:ligand-binding sensor domain-containing protein
VISIVQQGTIKPPVLVRLAVRCALVALSCDATLGMARDGAGRPDNQAVNLRVVRQADVMWFGTQYGLNRYDGYNYKLFVHDPRNPNSLSGVEVNALFKDRDGALWVGCDQFLNKFNRANETRSTFSTGGKDD